MDWTISPDLVRIVSPLALAHSAIGLMVVGVVMWLRSDNTLKLFGVGMGLFAAGYAIAAIVMGVRPAEDAIRWFALIGGALTLSGVLLFLRVGVEDYSLQWRRVAVAIGIVWAVAAIVLEVAFGIGGRAAYSEAGFLLTNFHAITAMWIVLGFAFAFFEAAHITVEHSHGEPYRTVILGAMAVVALSIIITSIADNDTLRFLNSLLGTLAAGVMWVAVVVHERKEIAREHEEM